MDFVVLALLVDLCVGFAAGARIANRSARIVVTVVVPLLLAIGCWVGDRAHGGETASWAGIALFLAAALGLLVSLVGRLVGQRAAAPGA